MTGDAGVGKTRLAYEALRAAASFRMTTLVGAAYEQEGQLPYQPFVEAFDRYLAEQRRPPEQHPITHFKPLGSSDPQQEHSAAGNNHRLAQYLLGAFNSDCRDTPCGCPRRVRP